MPPLGEERSSGGPVCEPGGLPLPRDSVFSAPRRKNSIRAQQPLRKQQNLLQKSAGRRGTIEVCLKRGSASAATSSSVIRRYFRRTDRLVSAYTGHDGISLTPAEVAYVTRKYSSHRRIPAEELAEIVAGRKA